MYPTSPSVAYARARGNGERGYARVMRWDRDRLRAALMVPLSEDARDAALLEARLADARASTGRDRLRVALRDVVNCGGRA